MSRLRLNQIPTPAAPASGKVEVYLDSSDGFLKLIKSDGSTARLSQIERGYSYFRQTGTSPERWYLAGAVADAALTSAATVGAKDILRAVPLLEPRGGTLDRIAIEVVTIGAVSTGTGKARLGIYTNTSDANLYPASLVLDCGEVDVLTTGVKALTIAQALAANTLYWLVLNHDCDTTDPVLRSISAGAAAGILGIASTFGTPQGNHWTSALTYAAMPATFTAGGSVGSGEIPAIGVRYSA